MTPSHGLRTADEVLLGNPGGTSLFVCSIYEDQRPLKGVAGEIDWRLKGFLSRFLMDGRISGAKSEFVYIPIKHQGAVRHIMLVGLGAESESQSKTRSTGDAALLTALANRVSSLHFPKVAISRSSFPFLDENKIKKALTGVDVEFTQ